MLKKFINPDDIGILWTAICKYIDKYEHHSLFMYEMAASLNSIVVNEPKLFTVRKFLQEWSKEKYLFYFAKMFRILKYNPSAVISLCLLSNQYELAYKIIKTLTGKY
jgi:vacuole morphology and inheritance protein 14